MKELEEIIKNNIEKLNGKRENLPFGLALEFAKLGKKIARKGWNGKNMFVAYMPELKLPAHNSDVKGPKVNERTAKYIGYDTPLDCRPYLAMFDNKKQWIPGWLASQTDLLSSDWYVLD